MNHRSLVRTLAVTVAALLTATAVPAQADSGVLSATPTTIAGATLDVTVPGASAPKGVSPDVFYDDATGTYYLYTTDMPPTVYTSTDGLSWTSVPGASLPGGFDWSVVKMGPNDYRMYYASINPSLPSNARCAPQRKQLRYATSTNLLTWTEQPAVLVDDVGCGVPHVLRKADGTYLLFYNGMEPEHGIYIATSPDGLTWTKRPGIIANESDLVDPAPLQMPDGTYLMVGSTTGSTSAQQLRILSSPDGLNWTLRSKALYDPANISVLDPSLKLINNQLRVWFGYAPGRDHANSVIATGNLTLKAGNPDSGSTSTSGTKKRICTKAGAVKKFQGSTYVCKKVKGVLVWVKR